MERAMNVLDRHELIIAKQLIEVLESRLEYYEVREEDARACAEWAYEKNVHAEYGRDGLTDKDALIMHTARRYLSGDYPKK
jgi:hypothetical protein